MPMRVRVMMQLARAIHYLHSGEPHIFHRDIKPQNFVVVEAEISERTGILRNVKVGPDFVVRSLLKVSVAS